VFRSSIHGGMRHERSVWNINLPKATALQLMVPEPFRKRGFAKWSAPRGESTRSPGLGETGLFGERRDHMQRRLHAWPSRSGSSRS
jgi:hypothetical protein